MMAYKADNVKLDRGLDTRAQAPEWLPESFTKVDASPDVSFEGYEYFYFPMEHQEMAPHGVIGNPFRATAEKGEQIFERFSDHLARAVEELKKVKVDIVGREYVLKA
jgi:creatinine amidohydrolase